jgi:glycosyltransferase involved in cell wall biosynthesis
VKISVLTPTFNRSHTLDRVYSSLMKQSYLNFEWIIVDDGSVDSTYQKVEYFKKNSKFPILYLYKENSGKVRSLNYASKYLDSEFTLVFDSDDWCDSDALEVFIDTWKSLSNKDDYCSISALKYYKSLDIVGDSYDGHEIENYIDRYNEGIVGDKWEFIRTDLFKKFSYPEIPEEKYMAPSFTWIAMARYYKTHFLNRKLSQIEYQHDGISATNISHRCKNPLGSCMVYEQYFDVSNKFYLKTKSCINYFRFYFRTKNSFNFYSFFIKFGFYFTFSSLIGYIFYLIDNGKLK